MHTVWKGAISFGLVHVPVKMFTATEEKDISMRMIHHACGTPLSYVRKCQHCNTEVEWQEIVKGYEYEPGRFVLFQKDELDSLSEVNREIRILDFVDLQEIDPIYFQKTYYLSPGDTGSNAYSLLLEAMRQSGRIGIAKVSIRSKGSLAAIRVIGNCLAMETIFYPDEIRPIQHVPNLPMQANVNERELTMARMLIDQLSTPFQPEKYTDDYRAALYSMIQAKIAGQEVRIAPERPQTNVVDLMAALQASLDAVGRPPAGPAAMMDNRPGVGQPVANPPTGFAPTPVPQQGAPSAAYTPVGAPMPSAAPEGFPPAGAPQPNAAPAAFTPAGAPQPNAAPAAFTPAGAPQLNAAPAAFTPAGVPQPNAAPAAFTPAGVPQPGMTQTVTVPKRRGRPKKEKVEVPQR
jgi:DNA end-binding protein Ku